MYWINWIWLEINKCFFKYISMNHPDLVWYFYFGSCERSKHLVISSWLKLHSSFYISVIIYIPSLSPMLTTFATVLGIGFPTDPLQSMSFSWWVAVVATKELSDIPNPVNTVFLKITLNMIMYWYAFYASKCYYQ